MEEELNYLKTVGVTKREEVTEETLLSILEDTCNKLNAASQI